MMAATLSAATFRSSRERTCIIEPSKLTVLAFTPVLNANASEVNERCTVAGQNSGNVMRIISLHNFPFPERGLFREVNVTKYNHDRSQPLGSSSSFRIASSPHRLCINSDLSRIQRYRFAPRTSQCTPELGVRRFIGIRSWQGRYESRNRGRLTRLYISSHSVHKGNVEGTIMSRKIRLYFFQLGRLSFGALEQSPAPFPRLNWCYATAVSLCRGLMT